MAKKAQSGKRRKTSVKGTMDITEQLKTWNLFWTGLKLSSAGILAILNFTRHLPHKLVIAVPPDSFPHLPPS